MKTVSLIIVFCHLLISLNVAFCEECPLLANSRQSSPCRHIGENLYCVNVQNPEELRKAFENAEKVYFGAVVFITDSNFPFIPHETFDDFKVRSLKVKQSSMIKLFDKPPKSLRFLKVLQIQNCKFLSQLTWDSLQYLTNMTTLKVEDTRVTIIGDDFGQYVPKQIKWLRFIRADTHRIKPGVLSKFHNLVEIVFTFCKLTKLTRDMLPIPYNGWDLHFDGNQITSIPDDLFTQMPDLHSVTLRNNLIKTLPEAAFNVPKMKAYFTGNPLKCDCSLVWYLKKRDPPNFNIEGTCSDSGKKLNELTEYDIFC